MSKFSLEVLTKHVFPYFSSNDPDVLLPPEFGEDIALTRVGQDILVSHVDPIVGAVKDIGWLAVHVASNDVATSGALPRWILLLVLVPSKNDVALLEKIMQDASKAADEIGATVIGGHTGYTANLSRPLVAVTALGVLSKKDPIRTKGAEIGDHVFLTKGVGLEGTAILANDFSQTAIRLGLSVEELHEASQLLKEVSIIPEALISAENGATAMHDVTRGGLLETLLEVAKLADLGIIINSQRIPIRPVVSRFAKAFDFDPLKMISSGSLVATVPPAAIDVVSEKLREKGIIFADIGMVSEGKGVKISQAGKQVWHQDIHCEDDDLATIWERYVD